ncbi:MAG: hypothetical protein QXT73_08880 [Candidatus Methanomethylicaceae archaeon]
MIKLRLSSNGAKIALDVEIRKLNGEYANLMICPSIEEIGATAEGLNDLLPSLFGLPQIEDLEKILRVGAHAAEHCDGVIVTFDHDRTPIIKPLI